MRKSPKRLRAMAAELRRAASSEANPERRSIMLMLAEGYEKIAALREKDAQAGEA
jgi:hypothetical protein